MNKTLGAIPSPSDIRDMTIAGFTNVSTEYEKTFSIIDEFLVIVKDQGMIPSCVAHACSEERDIHEYLQTGVMQEHSVGFIYANVEGTITDILEYEGMVARDAARKLVSDGDVLKIDLPENDFRVNLKGKLTPELFKKAFPRRVTSYYFIATVNELKAALKSGDIVIGMLPIYQSFYNPVNGIIPIPNTESERFDGYHEILFTGWNESGTRFLNSWGEDWGERGFATLPYNFPIKEMIAFTDKVNRYVEEVKQLYTDGDKVASWASEAVTECQKLGLMSGDSIGTFRPKDNLTREEAAQLVYNLYKKLTNK